MSINSKIEDCKIIELPKIGDRLGHISVVNNQKDIPFGAKRVFYLFDIPSGESRGAHAHKECHQFLIALSGSFEVMLNDGVNQKSVFLNRPNFGLHIVPGIWASEVNFSSGAICLVLASHLYDESDYIRDHDSFLEYKRIK